MDYLQQSVCLTFNPDNHQSFLFFFPLPELGLCILLRLYMLYLTQKTGDLISRIKGIILQRGREQQGGGKTVKKKSSQSFDLNAIML